MSYRFLDNIATSDAAFEATGCTLDELFQSAWEAVLKTMVENPDSIKKKSTRNINIMQNQLDLLLHDFLQELIFHKDAECEFQTVSALNIMRINDQYRLDARLSGEPIDPARHHMGVDVKAVTFHRLSVEELETGWRATVVLDV